MTRTPDDATRREEVERAAEAHTNLTTFAIVVSTLESGHLYGGKSCPAAQKIIGICQREQQRLLREYDRAIATVLLRSPR